MHDAAMENGKRFFDTYVAQLGAITLVDIGAMDVNGSLREACPPQARYIGVDMSAGKGVDIVLDDPYRLPFDDGSVDAVVSTSCFEHAEMFWLLFLEIMRVLKPEGLFYLYAPAQFVFHRYPVDCYRFYPDSGNALAKWGRRNGLRCIALEHFTTVSEITWVQDYVCVFLKDEAYLGHHPRRMLPNVPHFHDGCIYPDFDNFLSNKPK